MTNWRLHKYYTVNIFVFVNVIHFTNIFILGILLIFNYPWLLHSVEAIIATFFTAFVAIPVLAISIFIEFILRNLGKIKVLCNERFSSQQVGVIYMFAIILYLLYLSLFIINLLPPSPEEQALLRYD